MDNQRIDFNSQFRKALGLMENTNTHLFVTGRAGTGKSTLLTYFRSTTKKKVAVLAPTGVAALNVKGQTIHSFFRFKPDVTFDKVKKQFFKDESKNIYKKIDAIIIDEISMVRSDLLDCIDRFLRLNGRFKTEPFSGVQMIFIGDLYQLPPVVTSKERQIFRIHYQSQYFFDAKVFPQISMEFIELEKIYRQKDDEFITLLNAVRNNTATEEHLEIINTRFNPEFEPNDQELFIYLTTTNNLADEINLRKLCRLNKKTFYFEGIIEEKFEEKYLPTDIELTLKVGAQIMLLNNDAALRWVNGSIGKIKEIIEDENMILVELTNGKTVRVNPYTWELFHFSYDRNKNTLVSQTIGSFTQYPLMLAWAVTIHKSQGKTFDKVIIDIGKGTFTHGQLYVALSRCTKLEGIILKKLIAKKHIFMDWRVVRFITRYQYYLSEKRNPLDIKMKIIKDAIGSNKKLEIVYLKSNDEKSKRVIEPTSLGEMDYLGKKFLGVRGFDHKRQAERVFRVEKILEISAKD